MKSWKHILLFIIHFLIATVGFAQSEKIDSLKKVLPSLRDFARIDCLNALSDEYIPVQIDSVELFALQAVKEAEKINYVHGLAVAISFKAGLAFWKYNRYSESEKLAREAIFLFTKTSNQKRLNRICYDLGLALFAQSKFEEAISYYNRSYELSRKADDSNYIFHSLNCLGGIYLNNGEYKKAFEKALDLHRFALKSNNGAWKSGEADLIRELYRSIEDYNSALTSYRPFFQKSDNDGLLFFAQLFALNKQFDSAKIYYRLADTTSDVRNLRNYLSSIGEYYFLQNKYKEALPNFLRSFNYNKLADDRNQVMRCVVDIAKTYLALKNYDSALQYSHEALAASKQTGARVFVRDSYEVLYHIYDHRGKTDSAFFYHKRYVALKDTITSEQVAAKLVAYNFDEKIDLLNKENEVQQVQLQKESLLKNILLGGVVVLLLLGIIIFRNIILKRRNEKLKLENDLKEQQLASERTQAELKQQASELEMQALRAQMNPHFIFNSLNSINRFILQNNKAQASEYLTKFSKLVRLILQNSQAALIPLESELEALRLYLELEAVRFDHHFEYKIIVDARLDADILKVPPLIIQPYTENAIWHGLMNKEEKGHLYIELFQCEDVLCSKITDDGVGRKKAAELKSKSASTHKSMGMRITAERIAMLHEKKQIDTTITITDLVLPDGSAGGTEVLLKIPVML